MLFRSVLASAVAAAALLSTPALAQDAEALKAQVGAYVQPSNAERMTVLVAQLRAAGARHVVLTGHEHRPQDAAAATRLLLLQGLARLAP